MDTSVIGQSMVMVGAIEQLRRQSLTSVSADGIALVVIRTDTGFRVIENRCPHQQADILHEGTVDSNGLTCPRHARTFDLADGSCRNGSGRLTFLTTSERDGHLWVVLPAVPDFPGF